MAIDFTGILISLSDLRDRIGGPSTNPSSSTYVSDASLQTIIDLKQAVVEEVVERKMEQLTEDELRVMDVKFSPVNVAVSSSSNRVAVGAIGSDYLPVINKARFQDGRMLNFDPDIHSTAALYTDTGITKRRYYVAGITVYALPNTTTTLVLYLPTKDEVRQILASNLIDQANQEIIKEASMMIRDRVGLANEFKNESINEAP